jgi:D-alanyl-D-alanine carboxypeptidase/D-alanyl-D-alanine-endopeptidase (penicillin-binding protein 4)
MVVSGLGETILAINEDEPSVPASTIKTLTALAALSHLGEGFRFQTSFLLDSKKNLYVKGWGDPLLTSEVIEEVASSLAARTKALEAVILDDTFFERSIEIPGRERSTNPYDAPLGALCANFNTVLFKTGKDGTPLSAEPQTPMTEFAAKIIRQSGRSGGRISFVNDSGDAALYFGHLLSHFLREKGVTLRGPVTRGNMPDSVSTLVYSSRFALVEVLQRMMEYSNNFVANQVAITLGASIYGAPGNLKKAQTALMSFGRSRLGLESLKLVEGSGISRENRISPRDMITLLGAFERYREILKRSNRILFKSGTLRGIQARAGYIEGTGRPWRFAIFLEGSTENIDSMMKAMERAAR